MSVPRIPPKMIQVGLHWIMRMDDGVEDTTERPANASPEILAKMREANRLFNEEILNQPPPPSPKSE